MPTGYTADVQTGKVVDFPEFALRCARAFGALILMRDDAKDAEIPDEFAPSDYNAKALAAAKDRLVGLKAMTEDDIRRAAQADYDAALRRYRESQRQREEERARYEAMLDKALAWEPPTPEHVEMKSFMVSQLEESIRFDCGYEAAPPLREEFQPKRWHDDQIARAQRDVEYHTKGDREERERAAGRTAWVRALRDSLASL